MNGLLLRLFLIFLLILGVKADDWSEQLRQQFRDKLMEHSDVVADAARLLFGDKGGDRLFFMPTRDEPYTPAKYGYKFESIDFNSADGTRLHGWFLPAPQKMAKGTVIFSHGNTASIAHHFSLAQWFVDAGYNLFLYDYRGYGRSEGTPARAGMVADVQAAISYVAKRKDVNRQRLISFGHSLGGALSVAALSTKGAPKVRAVITDAAFASYLDMAEVFAGENGKSIVTDDLSPVKSIAKLTPCPLLMIHGTDDEVVPHSQGEKLFEAAAQPKTFIKIPKGKHTDSLSRQGGAGRKQLLHWLQGIIEPGV